MVILLRQRLKLSPMVFRKFSKNMGSKKEAILKTLLYSDLFDYPLTEAEIYRYLIFQKIDKDQFSKLLENKNLPIDRLNNFFFLKGRRKIVKARLMKKKFSL